ncbi:MAG: hypothetical protein HY606_08305 [Planctomycetes bacterium]|nr:hypothetical protein [Planctomycetota bacterium]
MIKLLFELRAILKKQLSALKEVRMDELEPLNKKCNQLLAEASQFLKEDDVKITVSENKSLVQEIHELLNLNQVLLNNLVWLSSSFQKAMIEEVAQDRSNYRGVFVSEVA